MSRRQVRKIVELVLTDVDLMARLRDAGTTSAFEEKHLRDAAGYKSRLALHRAMLGQVRDKAGLHLEFGVYKGNSINHFAELAPDVTWYGFDSFEGLPEAWTLGAKAGAFSIGGRLPPVRGNVRLTKGFFEQTLPGFVAQHRGETIALLHVDCDLYSSTVTILTNVADMIVPGTVIVFDELINYHGWEDGEFKAFTEFVAARNSPSNMSPTTAPAGRSRSAFSSGLGRSRYRDRALTGAGAAHPRRLCQDDAGSR